MKKIIFIIVIIAFFIALPQIELVLRRQVIAQASGPALTDFGIVNITYTPCIVTQTGCRGSTLCNSATPPCAYNDVIGTPSGGTISELLVSTANTTLIGLTQGGQMMGAVTSPTFTDSGVMASAGGCANCMAKKDNDVKYAIIYNIWNVARKLNNISNSIATSFSGLAKSI